jgi:hypothetical protein
MSDHAVLLGDSIFDNGAYTQGEPDVLAHLREMLPDGWQASLLALDGSTTASLAEQVARIPRDASRLFVSIGGNDILVHLDLLDRRVASTRDALLAMGERAARFAADYRSAIRGVVATGKPTTLCTIYEGNLPEPDATPARVLLMPFNDAILRVAFELGLDVIDLRLVCREPGDYANPIEPSGNGGHKIARAIVGALGLPETAHARVPTP